MFKGCVETKAGLREIAQQDRFTKKNKQDRCNDKGGGK